MGTPKTFIFHNEYKEKAVQFRKEYELLLSKLNISQVSSVDDADFFTVIGGDGTLLNFSKRVLTNPKPILAVNMGSLGFLTDVQVDEAEEMLKRVIENSYTCEKRCFLNIKVRNQHFYALNDFVISKCGIHSRMVSISVTANGSYVNNYRADGVIISSPTGSTAYSFSTGGPIVKPGLRALIINPIAPHNLNARPIVLPGDEIIELTSNGGEHELHIMLDGQNYVGIGEGESVSVTLSDKYINLISYPDRTYYDILRQKLKWGDKLF
jgi:NAD+ kinase